MSARRPSFDKRERDRAKKAKAAAKREKRLDKGTDEEGGEETAADEATSTATDQASVLAELEALHKRYDAEEIEFEDFEEQRTALLERLNVE